jgi:hypothetical protein
LTTRPEQIRALSEQLAPVEWPPRLDAHIHLNTGSPLTSWSADVRAVVDGEVMVLFKRATVAGAAAGLRDGHYVLMHRRELEGRKVALRYGALPRVLSQGEG